MKTLLLLLGGVWLAGVAWYLARSDAPPSPAELSAPPSQVLLEGVVLSEHTPDGDLVVEIDEVARVPGRVGFLRSPLVPGAELRGVTVRRGGEVVLERDRVELSARELAARGDLGSVLTGWSKALAPKQKPRTARERFEASQRGYESTSP